MEKLNLVKILKDCPKGTKLYSPALGECALEGFNDNNDYPITVTYKIINNDTRVDYFTKYGYLLINKPDAECMLFPSKDQRDWSKWHIPFVDGDIVFYDNCVSIFKDWWDETLFRNYVKVDINGRQPMLCDLTCSFVKGIEARFATEEEKQKLFDTLKAKGYKWNDETKTLEKLIVPKFKVGDKIRHKTANIDYVLEISRVYNDSYGIVGCGWMVSMEYQNEYELYPNKFDITTLKPFDKVLVRNNNTSIWINAFFGFYDIVITKKYPFVASAINWTQCIPYEGNEHLLGTYEDCDEYYKNW